jgi:hypothetical protein
VRPSTRAPIHRVSTTSLASMSHVLRPGADGERHCSAGKHRDMSGNMLGSCLSITQGRIGGTYRHRQHLLVTMSVAHQAHAVLCRPPMQSQSVKETLPYQVHSREEHPQVAGPDR